MTSFMSVCSAGGTWRHALPPERNHQHENADRRLLLQSEILSFSNRNRHVRPSSRCLTHLLLLLVLSDGPAVQDGGRPASLCSLHQTEQRSSGQQVRPREGPGAAAVHWSPGDGQDQTAGLLSPHPVR